MKTEENSGLLLRPDCSGYAGNQWRQKSALGAPNKFCTGKAAGKGTTAALKRVEDDKFILTENPAHDETNVVSKYNNHPYRLAVK